MKIGIRAVWLGSVPLLLPSDVTFIPSKLAGILHSEILIGLCIHECFGKIILSDSSGGHCL